MNWSSKSRISESISEVGRCSRDSFSLSRLRRVEGGRRGGRRGRGRGEEEGEGDYNTMSFTM